MSRSIYEQVSEFVIGSGGRTRTPNNRARTCRVADYTTPDRVPGDRNSLAKSQRIIALRNRCRRGLRPRCSGVFAGGPSNPARFSCPLSTRVAWRVPSKVTRAKRTQRAAKRAVG